VTNVQLRRGLREYSQGLPWSFRKLANHWIREVGEAATQEQLLAETLNVQSLFEADLAVLSAQEGHDGTTPTPVQVTNTQDNYTRSAGAVEEPGSAAP
jgi:hypothetical protein